MHVCDGKHAQICSTHICANLSGGRGEDVEQRPRHALLHISGARSVVSAFRRARGQRRGRRLSESAVGDAQTGVGDARNWLRISLKEGRG
eukprot:4834619-Pleurochrysis_carterae.AAC.1